jgi:iron-sulfur cluster assembly protein
MEKDQEISVSEAAAQQIKQQLEDRGTPNAFLRLGVKGGGCSGFSYVIQFEDKPPRPERDRIFQIEGVNLVIDVKSFIHLRGSTLDWEKSLLKQGFKFINPNEKSSCGCGHSFSV